MDLSNNQIQGTSGFFFFLQYLKIFRSCVDISADAKLEKVWNLRMINNMVHWKASCRPYCDGQLGTWQWHYGEWEVRGDEGRADSEQVTEFVPVHIK